MGVGMNLRIKGATKETTAWKKRIYFNYSNNEYIVNLFHDIETGYTLYWVKEGNKDYPEQPKWVEDFVTNILQGGSFESWLDKMTEEN